MMVKESILMEHIYANKIPHLSLTNEEEKKISSKPDIYVNTSTIENASDLIENADKARIQDIAQEVL